MDEGFEEKETRLLPWVTPNLIRDSFDYNSLNSETELDSEE